MSAGFVQNSPDGAAGKENRIQNQNENPLNPSDKSQTLRLSWYVLCTLLYDADSNVRIKLLCLSRNPKFSCSQGLFGRGTFQLQSCWGVAHLLEASEPLPKKTQQNKTRLVLPTCMIQSATKCNFVPWRSVKYVKRRLD